MKLQRIDNISQRVMDGDEIVGFALKLANGAWGAFDADEKRMSVRMFSKPKDVLAYLAEQEGGT